jgi:hypothetical protein
LSTRCKMEKTKVLKAWRKTVLILPLFVLISVRAVCSEGWQLIDRFKDVSLGEWEELVQEQGYVTSWMQIVIDLKKKLPVLIRERTPRGEIRETPIEGDKSNLNEDFYALLTARFVEETETPRVVVPAGRFACKQYYAIFNKKFVRIYFSDKIPLYPVKVVIPNYELVIKLVAFGKGQESQFLMGAKRSPEGSVGNTPE